MNNGPGEKTCAYCGREGPLTSEHVWPKGILKRTDFPIRYSARAGKTFSGDLTINDVCRECNNGPLSKVDSYFCYLYDQYFVRVPRAGETIEFRYDFALLMRALLKVAYNSSRSTGIDVELLSEYSQVLISEFPASPAHVAAFVGTAMSSRVKNSTSKKYTEIDPIGVRSGPILIPGIEGHDWCALRAVIINGFMFTIVLMRRPTVRPEHAAEVFHGIYGTPLLPSGAITIPPPKKTTTDFFRGVQDWPRGHR